MTRPLRVAIDARSLTSHRSSGQSMRELILRTASSGSIEWQLLTDGESPAPDLPVDELPAWVLTITTLLTNTDQLPRADRIGQAWARQYSRDAYVERTLAVYAEVLAARPERDKALAARPGQEPAARGRG